MDSVTGTRSRARREVGFGAALLAVGLIIGVAAGPAASAIAGVDPQKFFWTGSRLTGFLAYLAFSASVCYGLGMTSGVLDALVGRPVSFTLHQDLSLAGLAFTIAHVFLLLGDSYIGYNVMTLLAPGLSPYRALPVALGQVGALLAVFLIITFYLRKQIGVRLWRKLHTLSSVVFVLATIHGLYAGSDSGTDVIWWIYVSQALLVLFLLTYRIANIGARRTREPRAGV